MPVRGDFIKQLGEIVVRTTPPASGFSLMPMVPPVKMRMTSPEMFFEPIFISVNNLVLLDSGTVGNLGWQQFG